jgi:glucokinase
MNQMTIGIDLGGTRIKVGLVRDGTLTDSEIIDAKSGGGLRKQLPNIEKLIDQLLSRNGADRSQLKGIGATFPGIVDSTEMKIISTNAKYPDAPDIDLKAWATSTFSAPFAMDNDARISLLGEWQYGAGKGVDDLVMVTLGTGIGGAALMEGKLIRGKHFVAGCLGGHFSINYHGKQCQCGNIGCVEAEASSWRLPQLARESAKFDKSTLASVQVIDYEQVFKHAESGDELALELKNHSIWAWGIGIVNMIHAYDPTRVIVGGGIISHNDEVIVRFQEIVNKHTWTPWGKVEIAKGQWPEHNAILGCEYLLESKTNRPADHD